ncbi:MAG: hypothetical protein ABJG41_11910 [Cyclobacteriaceae bacterium]
MKRSLLISLILFAPLAHHAQTSVENGGKWSVALNTGFNGELYAFQATPSLGYFKNNSQLELGLGFNPFDRVDQTLLSGDINYKYFPNGIAQKFNLYFITQLSIIHNQRNTYYPATYNYLFMNAGYGFQIKLFEGAYLGTNVKIGTFTYNKTSENPYEGFHSTAFFDEAGFILDFQIHLNYFL